MAKGQQLRGDKAQTKKLLPFMRQFNKVAKFLIKSLSQKLDNENRQISKIAVMVTDIKTPEKNYNINIQTIDMNRTSVKTKGSMSYNQVMDWEKDMRKNRNKGIIL